VVVLFGPARYVPADLIVVHVDLSVVPEPYLEFSQRYPIVVNGSIRDIRKSSISRNLVSQNTEYKGPAIVKSDCNYAGMPERRYLPPQPNDAESLFKSP